MIAYNRLRDSQHYRRAEFTRGLEANGYRVRLDWDGRPEPGCVYVTWNRYGTWADEARQVEAAGGTVVVAENAYVGDGFALAIGWHNGAGRWREGLRGRWRQFGVDIKPWRSAGHHVLVLPQRGIGSAGVAMPMDWPDRIVADLRDCTNRPIHVRHHPGQAEPVRSLDEDLAAAWCAVTWGSGAAIKALAAGVPVFYAMPGWIGAPAAAPWAGDIEAVRYGVREAMFDRLAWAQWTLDEIASGEAFRWLLCASPV